MNFASVAFLILAGVFFAVWPFAKRIGNCRWIWMEGFQALDLNSINGSHLGKASAIRLSRDLGQRLLVRKSDG